MDRDPRFPRAAGPSPRLRAAAALTLAAVAVLAGLPGCAVGPDVQRPAAPEVPAYTRQPLDRTVAADGPGGGAQQLDVRLPVAAQWWTAFASPQLDALVAEGLAHSPTLAAAEAALRQAQALRRAQQAAFFPVAQAGYTASRQLNPNNTPSNVSTPLYTLHTAQLDVSYATDVFGLNRRSVQVAQAQEDVQRLQLEAARLSLASNICATAVQMAALQAQVQATNELVHGQQQALELLRRQRQAGMVSDLEVSAQEAALAQAVQTLPGLEKQLEQTRDALAVLTGRFPSELGDTGLALDALHLPERLPLTLPSQLVRQRPDVRAAEAQVQAASAQVGVALANRLPQFQIAAAFGGSATTFASMFDAGYKFWSVAGSVTQTLVDFGALRERQRAAEAQLDQAQAEYRSTVLGAFQNVADTLYALQADARSLAAAADAERATRRTWELTRRQLQVGAVNGLALLTAEQAWQQARLARIQAQAQRHVDTVALYQALGGGWSDGLADAGRSLPAAAAIESGAGATR